LHKTFTWGHVSEEKYLRERDRLEAVRTEMQAATRAVRTIKLEGILDAWIQGNASGRRRLLGDLFDALHVTRDGITGYTPRSDHQAEVIDLLERTWLLRRERDSNPRRLEP
jgi:hypothetical protein